jgi:enamine deaminase RidA (YjgF/YER057c/UK114 family)
MAPKINALSVTRHWPGACRLSLALVALALGACAAAPPPTVDGTAARSLVVRHPNADPASVTSRAVEALPGAGLVFLSGQTPEPAAPEALRFSAAYWGDTETQTLATLAKLDRQLKGLGLSMADVVKLQVFLVGEPGVPGSGDSAGFERAYVHWSGASPTNTMARPARTVVQVAALGHPGVRVEIDAIAVRR